MLWNVHGLCNDRLERGRESTCILMTVDTGKKKSGKEISCCAFSTTDGVKRMARYKGIIFVWLGTSAIFE